MINDDITRQIAADYARLLTSTPEGFDLTLAEAIDSDLLPEDVLETLCEMLLGESWEQDMTAANKRAKKLHSTPDPTFNDRMQASATPSQPKNSSDLPTPTPTKSSSWLPKSLSDRLSHWRNARNSTKRNLTGAAFDSSAEKAITRRAHFHAAKAGDVENQKTIRDHLNTKGGLKDKLRAAGIGTKVRVRVDKETGHYHVTDATGKTHVIESKVIHDINNPIGMLQHLRANHTNPAVRKGITISPEARASAVAAGKKSGDINFLPKRQRAALYKKWNDSHRQFVKDANSRTDDNGKRLDPYDNNDS